jgi:hypothetical protein
LAASFHKVVAKPPAQSEGEKTFAELFLSLGAIIPFVNNFVAIFLNSRLAIGRVPQLAGGN